MKVSTTEKIDPEVMAKAQAQMQAQQQQSTYGRGENPVTYHIICDQRITHHRFTAAYFYWAVMELLDGNSERVKFYDSFSEMDLSAFDPDTNEIYAITDPSKPSCAPTTGQIDDIEYVLLSHPYQIWNSLIRELSYYPYSETIQCFYGFIDEATGEIEGKQEEYAKHFATGMSLFDTRPDNASFWQSLFSEERWLIPDYEPGQPLTHKEEEEMAAAEAGGEDAEAAPERKFSKFASPTAKKKKKLEAEALKKAMLERKVSQSQAKPHELFRQRVYNAGVVLDVRLELADRYFIDNFNYDVHLPLNDSGKELLLFGLGNTEIVNTHLLAEKVEEAKKAGTVYAGWVLSTRANNTMTKLVMDITVPDDASKEEVMALIQTICDPVCCRATHDCGYRLNITHDGDARRIAGTILVDTLGNMFG